MKWLLVVIVMNTPVKTDLVFQSLPACLQAESQVRKEWSEIINKTIAWQNTTSMSSEEKQQNTNFVMQQSMSGTCIPTK